MLNKLLKEINSLLRLIGVIGWRTVNQEPMVKRFTRDWSKVVESLRVNAILQFKTNGKVKI